MEDNVIVDEVVAVEETVSEAPVQEEPVAVEPVKEVKRRGIRGVKSLRVKELIETMGLEDKPALVKAIMEEFGTTKTNANAFIFNVKAKM